LDAQITAGNEYLDRAQRLADEAEPSSFERLFRSSKVGAALATLAWLRDERARLAG